MANQQYEIKQGESLLIDYQVYGTGETVVDLSGSTAIHSSIFIKELEVAKFSNQVISTYELSSISGNTITLALTRDLTKNFPTGYITVITLIKYPDADLDYKYEEYSDSLGQVVAGKKKNDLFI